MLLQEIGSYFASSLRAEPLLPHQSTNVPKLLFRTKADRLTFATSMCAAGDGGGYISTANRAAIDILSSLAMLISRSIQLREGSTFYAPDQARAEGTAHFIRSALLQTEPDVSFTPPPEDEPFSAQGQLRGMLADGLIGFLVGREIARCIHLDVEMKAASPADDLPDSTRSSWPEEFKLDLVAEALCRRRLMRLAMAISSMLGRPDAAVQTAGMGGQVTAMMSALSFLIMASLTERATGDVWAASRARPPALLRLASLWRSYEMQGGEGVRWLRANRFDAPMQCVEHLMPLVCAVGSTTCAQRTIKEFQDSVFLSAFAVPVKTAIAELEGMMLDLRTGHIETGLQPGSVLRSWWKSPAEILMQAIRDAVLTVSEGEEAIGSSIQILRRLLSAY
ncbi:MAG: hypothetical protein ABSD56_00250 [Bryobacteraceae bacterium]